MAVMTLAVSLSGLFAPARAASPAPVDAAPYCSKVLAHGPAGRIISTRTSVQGCRYYTGAATNDPAIAVTTSGVMFVAVNVGGVMRSSDHGHSWTYIPVPALPNGDSHASGGHGFVDVDPRTNRVYYLTSLLVHSCGGVAGSVLSWSDNLGRSWHGVTVACDTYDWGRVLTGPAPRGNRYPSVIYFFGVGIRPVGGERFVYRSSDGGRTWQKMSNIASATTEAGAGVSAKDGTVYFDYPEFDGFDPTRVANQTYPFVPQNTCREMVAVSQDYGVTWRQVAIPGSLACNEGYGEERVAVDQAGTVYAVWTSDVDGRLYMTYSRDKAKTWSSPIDVMPPGTRFNNGSGNVIAGAPGHIFVASQDTAESLLPVASLDPRVFIVPASGDWSTYVTESYNATSPTPSFVTASLDPVGDPSYRHGTVPTQGEAPTEAECYLAMTPIGQGWTVFTRHGAGTTSAAPTYVGTLVHP